MPDLGLLDNLYSPSPIGTAAVGLVHKPSQPKWSFPGGNRR